MNDSIMPQLTGIAAALGGGWVHNKIAQKGFCHYLTNGNKKILIRYEHNSNYKKVAMQLIFKHGAANKQHEKTIGLSINKPARAIAADIKRRLLPGYEEALKESEKNHKERENIKQNQKFVIEAFKRVYPLKERHQGLYFGGHPNISGWIKETFKKDRHDMDLHNLPPELVIKILSMVKEYEDRN